MSDHRKTVLRLAAILWYGLLVVVALGLLAGPVHRAAKDLRGFQDVPGILELVTALLGLGMLVVLFLLVAALVRWGAELSQAAPPRPAAEEAEEAEKEPPAAGAFPAPVTLVAGGWLVVIALLSVAGLTLLISAPDWLERWIGTARQTNLEDLLVTAMAGAVGGSVSTLLAFLKHASEEKDFEVSYVPWYVARPLLGLLLGLITFFLVKGGLLATLPEVAGKDFNNLGLAGVGSLVGMFSKNAVEKLREVFHTLFNTQADARRDSERELLSRLRGTLPPGVWEQVQGALKPKRNGSQEDGSQEEGSPGDEAQKDGSPGDGSQENGSPGGESQKDDPEEAS
jgi:hypothetical protein